MNIKKQLRKIRDYVEALEELSDKQHEELLQYQLAAYKFVKFESPDHIAREEFKKLLGDTMFVGGDFVMKYNGVAWDSIKPDWFGVSHDESYNNLIEENAQLREMLRWHPVSEKPKNDELCLTPVSETVILQRERYFPITAYCRLDTGVWLDLKSHEPIRITNKARWCYIPEYKDGE